MVCDMLFLMPFKRGYINGLLSQWTDKTGLTVTIQLAGFDKTGIQLAGFDKTGLTVTIVSRL